jgi:S-adenosylmethionine:tRNA-ribosyltransferase-isomerase (queuine synthetase)
LIVKDIKIQDYTYVLPDERIAKFPLQERDASKLLIYKKGDISESTYRQIAAHIPADSCIFFNNTKVIPARLLFQREMGGVIEVFYVSLAMPKNGKRARFWASILLKAVKSRTLAGRGLSNSKRK